MNNENQPVSNQTPEQPKNFWQRLKLWQKIGLIVLAVVIGAFSYYILIRPLLFPPTLFYSSITEAPDTAFNAYLRAEENCDIDLANSIITEKSKEIMHYTCSNMADERKCHINKTYKVLTKGDTAIIHFDDFSHKTGWPFFFAKENGEWKIDFYKMAYGIAMGGSGCDTGWSWRNEEIKNEFCSYFKEGECPEEIVQTTDTSVSNGPANCSTLKAEIKSLLDNLKYCDYDSDCILDENPPGRGSCIMGCYLIRNKHALIDENPDGENFKRPLYKSEIEKIINQYDDKCGRCLLECPYPPKQEDIKCLNNKCTDIRF